MAVSSYERLGEQATNELVEWFNAVDATYRADLRELNELNFARFDAKLDQRIADVRASIAALEARLEHRLGEQTCWMFAAWASLMAAVIGFGSALITRTGP